MYEVVSTKRYRTSYKRVSRYSNFDRTEVEAVIEILAKGDILPSKYKDHQLTGSLKEFRECHIRNDLLLMYQKQDKILILYLLDIGTHSSLFG